MNPKQLAAALNGIDYRECASIGRGSSLIKSAKAAGLVVAYGYSDDLIEFEGAITDEVGAPCTVLFDERGILPCWESIKDDEEECAAYFERKKSARSIHAIWHDDDPSATYAWTLETTVPHETFSIIEDDEGFSLGIVFSLADLKAKS